MSATSAARAVRAPAAPARPLGAPRGRAARSPAVVARSATSRPASRPAPAARAASPSRRADGREPDAPRVRLVAPPASSRRRLPFGILCGAVLLLSLLAVLLLNISLSHGAYELHALAGEQQDAGERREALAEQLERTGAPAELGRRAAELGMVPAGTAAVVRLPDGEVVGVPTPAAEPAAAAEGAAAGATGPAVVEPVDPDDVAADEPAPAQGAAVAAESAGASDDTADETAEESAP